MNLLFVNLIWNLESKIATHLKGYHDVLDGHVEGDFSDLFQVKIKRDSE